MSNNHIDVPQAPSVGLDDFLYLFFRHKWKIIFFTAVGCAVAGWFFFTEKTEYRAQAKLLVRYITEKKDPNEIKGPTDPGGHALDPHESSIMSAEAEILRSSDCIRDAVKAVGIKRVLKAYDGGTNEFDAVELVLKKVQVDLGKGSGLMAVTLSHRDADIAQELLGQVVLKYQMLHQKAHTTSASYDEIGEQKDQVKRRLIEIENLLKSEKKKVGIWSLDLSKSDLSAQMTDLKKEINESDAQIAELRALLDEFKPANSGTNDVADAKGKSDKIAVPSQADIARFNLLQRKLNTLRSAESDLVLTFSESSKKVQQVRADIKETEADLEKLPIDPAYLARLANSGAGQNATSAVFNSEVAQTKLFALLAKYQTLTNRLASVRAEAAHLDGAEDTIVELERQKKDKEEALTIFQRAYEELQPERLRAAGRGNISIIQTSTRIPPDSKKLMKKAGGAVAGGVGFGFLMALLLDFVFNPSVKRSKDLESGIKLPVLASIPDFGRALKLKGVKKNGSALQKNGATAFGQGEIAPWEDRDPMLPYYEALRDRVVMSYNGDLHKPKIVGLTSCHSGAGVSRLSTGLAASLSRDAERNVLLVALQRNKVAVSAFAKGRPTDGIEAPPEGSQSEKEVVAQNLYSLATTGRNLAGASVVQSFSDLLPKLKISEYDYIIFDLPPLTQTSGALRLASQMERTILVVEAEETNKDKVKRVKNLLKASHANIYTVLNKTHSYGPKSIREDS